MYPTLDTSSGTASLPYRALRQNKIQLQDLLLHDTWRTLHPNDKVYTFFSAPHNRYTRLDYLFVSQIDLHLLTNTTLEPMLLSDPISITLTLPDKNTFTKIGHLDLSLLTSEPIVNQICEDIGQFFSENYTPDTALLTQWEAHKCIIRGKFLALKASCRKAQQNKI